MRAANTPSAAFLDAIAAEFPPDSLSLEPADLVEYGRDWTRLVEPAPAAIALPRRTDEVARIVRLCAAPNIAFVPSLFDLVGKHRGSISAEHGVGLLKKAWLSWSRTAEELDVMRFVKRALDPQNLLNPEKIFDG